MTSKWINDVVGKFLHNPVGQDWNDLVSTLERIDKLLRAAMLSTDNELLYDEIRKELKND
jgi:hypothetical protein